MARFDVYMIKGFPHYVMDVQADLLRDLNTRLVIPLVPLSDTPNEAMLRLRPDVRIGKNHYLLSTPEMAAVPCSVLGDVVANLEDQRGVVIDAIDFVLQGF